MVVGWLWWLGRDASSPAAKEDSTAKKYVAPANLPSTLVNSWPAREAILEQSLAINQASATKNSPPEPVGIIAYKQSDLTIVPVATSSAEAYGKSVAQILKPYSVARPNELTLLGQAYDTQDKSLVEKLAAIRIMHQKALHEMRSILVPNDAANLHLTLVNSLSVLITLSTDMEQILSQPTLALQAGQLYQLGLINFYSQLNYLNDYFLAHQITFTSAEKINIFVNTQ